MIVWKGYGILVIIISAIFTFLFSWLNDAIFADPKVYSHIFVGSGLILSSIPIWHIGKKVNKGNQYDSSYNHSLFFIKMEYYAFVCIIFGAIMMIK